MLDSAYAIFNTLEAPGSMLVALVLRYPDYGISEVANIHKIGSTTSWPSAPDLALKMHSAQILI